MGRTRDVSPPTQAHSTARAQTNFHPGCCLSWAHGAPGWAPLHPRAPEHRWNHPNPVLGPSSCPPQWWCCRGNSAGVTALPGAQSDLGRGKQGNPAAPTGRRPCVGCCHVSAGSRNTPGKETAQQLPVPNAGVYPLLTPCTNRVRSAPNQAPLGASRSGFHTPTMVSPTHVHPGSLDLAAPQAVAPLTPLSAEELPKPPGVHRAPALGQLCRGAAEPRHRSEGRRRCSQLLGKGREGTSKAPRLHALTLQEGTTLARPPGFAIPLRPQTPG